MLVRVILNRAADLYEAVTLRVPSVLIARVRAKPPKDAIASFAEP